MNGEDFRTKQREFKLRQKSHSIPGDIMEKVTLEEEKKMINASTVKLFLEDHTLGNLIRMGLLRHKDVTFSGYKEQHPLQDIIEIKVQTNGNVRPIEAFRATVSQLTNEFASMEQQWSNLVENHFKRGMKTEFEQ